MKTLENIQLLPYYKNKQQTNKSAEELKFLAVTEAGTVSWEFCKPLSFHNINRRKLNMLICYLI